MVDLRPPCSVASDAVHQLQLHILTVADLAAPTVDAAREAAVEVVKRPGAGPFDGLAQLMEQLLTVRSPLWCRTCLR